VDDVDVAYDHDDEGQDDLCARVNPSVHVLEW
jgi:hypothetical protein